ncbi:MAG: hypothetical protein KatS3mg076_1923 [Candidatus Binatia bacterium]|nr:MAG: hypothetical protein KatS3mg076_1923 [Candidatus Binatia bacterium]
MALARAARRGSGRFPREYLERLIESSPDIVVAVDRSGTITFYNDGAEKILGYSAPEILGANVVQLYPSLEEAKRVMAAMRSDEYGGPGKVKNFETTFVDRLGNHIPVAISGSILYDEAGLEIGSIGFAKDLREIRRHERLATLGEVAVGLCHEINSPLEVILNQLSLLEQFVRRKANEEELVVEEERIEGIRREVGKVQAIIARLVDLASGEEYRTREYLEGTRMADLSPRPRVGAGELAGLRILVVDDDLGVCTSLRDLLEAEGCRVYMAGGGEQALEILEKEPCDLVISDVVMPDLDGYELFRRVRETRKIPVVLMTGYYYDRDHVIKRSRMEGLEGVLFKKPIDPERLKEVILEQCRPARATGS